ncbi:Myb-related protein A [Armadillidium nasatum]|uniref:Myb-related protein A n=1 Tax=Armadillidium nasatum TaxID=96803 RepID=A0A5N5SYI0_9CRUS|nr:Myb-related protein A [Armadillidium nasatum]
MRITSIKRGQFSVKSDRLTPFGPNSNSNSLTFSPAVDQGFLLSPIKGSLYHDLGIISPLKYFDDITSFSPLKNDKNLENLRNDLDIGAFELLTCSPIKIKVENMDSFLVSSPCAAPSSSAQSITVTSGQFMTCTTPSVSNLSQSSSFLNSRLTTPPILRRNRRKQVSPSKRGNLTLSRVLLTHEANTSGLTTPVKFTPRKTPGRSSNNFSPSQFLKSPQQISFEALTSTPVMGPLPPLSLLTPNQPTPTALGQPGDSSQSLNTPTLTFHIPTTQTTTLSQKTPKSRRVLIHPTPKTPTPLKNALKEIEKKSGPLKQLPQTPTHFEDIAEMIRKETEVDGSRYQTPSYLSISGNQSNLYESGYGTLKRKLPSSPGKENSPNKKAKKALIQSWGLHGGGTQGNNGSHSVSSGKGIESHSMSLYPETPSDSRCIKRISFQESPEKKNKFSKLDVRWEMVACGKTENQRRLTEQARQIVSQSALKPRSLNL